MIGLERYLTPYKLGRPVLTGSGIPGAFDELAVDCPFVFEHHNQFTMMFVGFDGHGDQTGLAHSTDLLHWEKLGILLRRGEGNPWDSANAAGAWLLCENDLERPRTLKKWQGKYWKAYHSYPGEGYEIGPARIGLAWSDRFLRRLAPLAKISRADPSGGSGRHTRQHSCPQTCRNPA